VTIIVQDEIELPKGSVEEFMPRLVKEPQTLPESVRRRCFVIATNKVPTFDDDDTSPASHEDWRRLNE
jgi:hypothetical protein